MQSDGRAGQPSGQGFNAIGLLGQRVEDAQLDAGADGLLVISSARRSAAALGRAVRQGSVGAAAGELQALNAAIDEDVFSVLSLPGSLNARTVLCGDHERRSAQQA